MFLIKVLSNYGYSKAMRNEDSDEVSSTVKSDQCIPMRVFISEAARKATYNSSDAARIKNV